ncbi:SAM-dependent methyltransferase [Microlunatus panaciterrae]|uniref:SAM-dependent methyltransferase n=1 Tax=Microlunatus panaciterrae TaxID=400768 RepID=A0ABS2RHH6_9ACTN|nr:site-specific DNA-methyltransferase [Microlunatus panaciterrae]MBM7798460.1 SAM-dependent methyltransferase [Microlunatus panaciterrae]
MTDYLILLAPSSNRVYSGSADTLVAAELEVMCGGLPGEPPTIEPVTVAGVGYLQLSLPELGAETTAALSRLSALFAVFERVGDQLRPIEVSKPDLFDDDLVSIPKYQGKTNEQFTRLLLNVTLASLQRPQEAPLSILDPLCGRGTTLSTGLIFGHDVAGVEGDLKAVEAYAAFLRTYLRRKRLKHSAEMSPVRRDGKSLGRRLDVEVTPPRTSPSASGPGRPLSLTVFSGDTRQSLALYGKRRFDAVVTDAPYGVVHGSHTDVRGVSGKRDRSPAGLLRDAVGVWAQQLKKGGALGLSWNTYGLSREDLTAIAEKAGLQACADGPYLRFGHRVDSSIYRDLFVAVKV